jgi:hypothetical protein
MALIQIKRSTSNTPSSLQHGELAARTGTGELWVGNSSGEPILVADPRIMQALAVLFNSFANPSNTAWKALHIGFTKTTQALTAGRCYFMPFGVFSKITVTALAIDVSTASAGTAELAIYSVNATGNAPVQRLAYISGLDTGTTGLKSGTVSVTLEPGAYFAALRASAAATVRAFSAASQFGVVTGGTALPRNNPQSQNRRHASAASLLRKSNPTGRRNSAHSTASIAQ